MEKFQRWLRNSPSTTVDHNITKNDVSLKRVEIDAVALLEAVGVAYGLVINRILQQAEEIMRDPSKRVTHRANDLANDATLLVRITATYQAVMAAVIGEPEVCDLINFPEVGDE